MLASETCALDLVGPTTCAEVEPGEIIVIDATGRAVCSMPKPVPAVTPSHCIFELIYFARPDSQAFWAATFISCRKVQATVWPREHGTG